MPANNEGRIRPSLIAARVHFPFRNLTVDNEGRIRPSLIAASRLDDTPDQIDINEGRIRPSLIAAAGIDPSQSTEFPTRGEFAPPSLRHGGAATFPRPASQRGANSPLPHCGMAAKPDFPATMAPTRGEFAPPSLRQRDRGPAEGRCNPTRGEFAPPSLRHILRHLIHIHLVPTRGEFAPPSLRHHPAPGHAERYHQRGANSPLPHCGMSTEICLTCAEDGPCCSSGVG